MKGGSLRNKRHELDSLKRELTATYRSGEPENDDYAQEAERLDKEVNAIVNTLRNMEQSVVDIEKQIETIFKEENNTKVNQENGRSIIRLLKIVKKGLKDPSKHDTDIQRENINTIIDDIQDRLKMEEKRLKIGADPSAEPWEIQQKALYKSLNYEPSK